MPRFLIVDDDAFCQRLLKAFLAPFGPCDLAYDGREAIGAFRMALDRGEPYDLVCLDIMMDDTNGHDVLDAIRQLENDRGIQGSGGVKVIMTTGVRDSKDCLRAFSEGCESYLTKPIEKDRFVAEVCSLLGMVEPGGQPKPTPAATAPPLAARRGRFLVVDDDGVCRELLKDLLRLHADCDFAYNGKEAIDAVRLALDDGSPYDLVCLDIMMPGTSGHEALREIRQVEARHGIGGSDGVKVIMTTALRDPKHCIQAFREGCECYVTKPVREEELLTSLRQLGLLA
jgi:two-component system chemotaxis response regulator CheY